MCVTNFVKRTPRPVTVAVNPAALSSAPSLISQRLHGNFLPLLVNTPVAKPATEATVNSNIFASCHNGGFGMNHPSGDGKTKPKRKRKPQKPGLTAKKNERHFVKHNYHDHAFDTGGSDVDDSDSSGEPRKPCSTARTFPMKLHALLERLEQDGLAHIVSWQLHGRCFCIHKPKEFTEMILPTYLRQAKLTSFQRQLNLYGFQRLTRGKDTGGYYHELFLRGKGNLTKRMKRTKIKGTKFKAASSPDQEPDFYSMPPVTALPHVSDESSADHDSHTNDSSAAMPVQVGNVVEFSSSVGFEPIPLQIPRPQVFHTPIEPYPMFSTANRNNSATNANMMGLGLASAGAAAAAAMKWDGVRNAAAASSSMIGGFCNTGPSQIALPSTADYFLDNAVDELFNNADSASASDDVANLEDLWDPVAFGEADEVGRIDDDLQLGNLLETFLNQS